jgi:hypothetical protein
MDKGAFRIISQFMLAFMLLAQLALAQHATIHVSEGAATVAASHQTDEHAHHNAPDDHTPDAHEKCSLCLLTKAFSQGFVSAETLAPALPRSSKQALLFSSALFTQKPYAAHRPRGPPSFLI